MSHPKLKIHTPLQAWERQPRETEEAHAAFLLYRDQGVDRSLERVSRAHAKSLPNLKTFSAKWNWVERARQWDNYLQSERDKVAARFEAIWERRRLAALQINYEIAQALRAKARRMLEYPLHTQASEDGKTVIQPARWTMSSAADMFKLSLEMEAAALKAAERPIGELSLGELRAVQESGEREMLRIIKEAEGEAD